MFDKDDKMLKKINLDVGKKWMKEMIKFVLIKNLVPKADQEERRKFI